MPPSSNASGTVSESVSDTASDVDVDIIVPAVADTAVLPGDNDRKHKQVRQMGGAAVVAGTAGLLLVGPIVGLAAAGAAAAVATTKGKAGDVSRATGEAAASVGDRVKAINQKHHITEKASKGIIKGANWVSDKVDNICK